MRPNQVCAATLGEIPGGIAYVKNNPINGPKTAYPIRWLGFVCACRARKLLHAKKGKLVATAVTNGDVIGGEWRELRSDQYVLGMLIQVGEAHEFGAWAVVDNLNWPIVLSEDGPRLTIVSEKQQPSVRPFLRKAV